MSAKTLKSMYSTLSREERTALAYAAAARGDEVELDRLHGSAPRERWILPNHNRVFRAVSTCAIMHRAEQLELVATYWFATVRANEGEALDTDPEKGADGIWLTTALTCAHRFCVNVEAFQSFCEELGICVDDVMSDIPGGWLIRLAETCLPTVAPPPEELEVMIRRELDIQDDIVTVAYALDNLRSTYEALSGI